MIILTYNICLHNQISCSTTLLYEHQTLPHCLPPVPTHSVIIEAENRKWGFLVGQSLHERERGSDLSAGRAGKDSHRRCVRPPPVFGSCPMREFRNVDTVHMGERASERGERWRCIKTTKKRRERGSERGLRRINNATTFWSR